MYLLAIDPGTIESAYVVMDGLKVVSFAKETNDMVVYKAKQFDDVVLEMVASYGMPVGREVFETVFWTGRFFQASGVPNRLYRQDVKLHLCKSPKANDASIRQALIDRYGPGKDKAIGTKKAPGPLYGVTKDVWAALALAVTWQDTRTQRLAHG